MTWVPTYPDNDPLWITTDEFEQYGVVTAFDSKQIFDVPSASLGAFRQYLTLLQFEDESAATTFFEGYFDRVAPLLDAYSDNVHAPAEREIDLGDESTTLLWVQTYETQASVVTRVGDVVILARWIHVLDEEQAVDEGSLAAAEEELLAGAEFTAQEQLKCLDAGACPAVVELAGGLLPE